MSDFTRRLPCLLCTWSFTYSTALPPEKQEALRMEGQRRGLEHYIREHSGVRGLRE